MKLLETLPSDPNAAALARDALSTFLADLPDASARENALLVASELVTNAVNHGTGPIELKAGISEKLLRIEVLDSSSTGPRVRRPTKQESSGRGMQIVTTLTAQWGWDATDAGKTVWAEIAINA